MSDTEPARRADPVREIVRSLPDNFWDVEVWTSDGNWVYGEMDVAQRYRIVRELKRQIDGDDYGPGAGDVDDTPEYHAARSAGGAA